MLSCGVRKGEFNFPMNAHASAETPVNCEVEASRRNYADAELVVKSLRLVEIREREWRQFIRQPAQR